MKLSSYQNGTKEAHVHQMDIGYVTVYLENGQIVTMVKSATEDQAEAVAESFINGSGPASLLQEQIINSEVHCG
jgi:hypothetical protein